MSKKKDKKSKGKSKAEKKKQTRSDGQPEQHRPVRWGLVVLLSLLAIVFSLFWIPAELRYTITETYTFSAEDVSKVNLIVLLPTSGPNQEVLEPAITWPGTWEMALEGRLNVLRLVAEIEEDQAIEAEIKYRVNLWQGEAKWVGDPVLSDDLDSSEDIQSDNPWITDRADQLWVKDNPRKTSMNIFDFTIEHLAPPEGAQPWGAIEYVNLMAALCRSADVPTHTVRGLLIPEIIPFITVSAEWNHPANTHDWVEVHVGDVWLLADPSRSGQFYQRDLFGWTDGKHLVYDKTINLEDVYETLVVEAEDNGMWIESSLSPLYFVAWSDAEGEALEMSPMITVRKTWDGRMLMIASVIIILMVLNWLYEEDKRRLTGNKVRKDEQKGE
jgi:hypothetical protein